MVLYRFWPSENAPSLRTKNEPDLRTVSHDLSHGAFRDIGNHKIVLQLSNPGDSILEMPDFPAFFPDGLLATDRAYEIFSPFLANCGKWTTMWFQDCPLHYFSTLIELDILDVDKTEFVEINNIILDIRKYRFRDICVADHPIFRLSYNKVFFPLVSKEFIDLYSKYQMSGLEFTEVGS